MREGTEACVSPEAGVLDAARGEGKGQGGGGALGAKRIVPKGCQVRPGLKRCTHKKRGKGREKENKEEGTGGSSFPLLRGIHYSSLGERRVLLASHKKKMAT